MEWDEIAKHESEANEYVTKAENRNDYKIRVSVTCNQKRMLYLKAGNIRLWRRCRCCLRNQRFLQCIAFTVSQGTIPPVK